jgi:signal transduction histidine kinase
MTAVSLLIALVTIVYSVLIYNRENRAKLRAIANAKSYSMQLEERVQDLDRANRELEELRSMEKFAATGRIARTIAHEVRNPLTNIALASEQVRELTDDNEESDVLLDMIGRNVNRINQLVSELLNSTRFGQLEYSSVQINDLLDEALELAQDRMELKEIELEKHYAPDLCHVYVDKEKMKIALLNIIVNALEAMEKGKGQLVFRTRVMDDRCQIEISDNGVGMDEETLARLFEPYFTSKKKGNGLGLTNTQNIILNHKGNIQVKSKPGAGTTFIVTLNMNRKPVESEEKSPQNV